MKTLIINILTGNGSAQFYFIILLIIFYFIYPFIYRLSNYGIFTVLIITINILGITLYQIYGIFGFPYFYNWIIYFYLGIMLAKNDKLFLFLKNNSWKIFISGFILMLTSCFYFFLFSKRDIDQYTSSMRFTIILYSIGILSVFISHFYKPLKTLKVLDKNSMTIYYSHLLILTILKKLFNFFNSNDTIIVIVLILVTATLSTIFSILFTKFKSLIKLN